MPYTATNGIETVFQRGQGAHNFALHYDGLCALQSSVPLATVKAHLADHRLEINADKIRLTDWGPILKTIKINKNLQHIAVRSHYQAPDDRVLGDGSRSASKRQYGSAHKLKPPCIHSRDLSFQLCKALKDCLITSDNLTTLSVEGIPLRQRDLIALSKGIAGSGGLRELSLASSRVAEGLDIVCRGLRDASSINTLNLSHCGLAEGAVQCIARVVKHQTIMRHSEAWKSSLRYRIPDLDCMPGLRRITLNKNPLLGDTAAFAFAEVLTDDLWLKAIDMQECGITEAGVEALLEALRLNSTLHILDIRRNHLIDRNHIQRVMQQLMINREGKICPYDWLPTTPPVSNHPIRTFVKGSSSTFKTPAKTHLSPTRNEGSPKLTPRTVPKQKGLPWRTAERAAHYKEVPVQTPAAHNPIPTIDVMYDSDSETCSVTSDIRPLEDADLQDNDDKSVADILKQLQAENISLKRRLNDESAARVAAEDRALELARENRRLVAELRRRSLASATDQGGAGVNEQLLSEIELAFTKFNQFIDLVRASGFGHLISEAGLGGFDPDHPAYIPDDVGPVHRDPAAEYKQYVMSRQMPSDDIIPHVDRVKSPKKTIVDYVVEKNAGKVRDHLERKRRHREQKSNERMDTGTKRMTPVSKSLKFTELRDVSELETPKDTPRKANVATQETLAPTAEAVTSQPPVYLESDNSSSSKKEAVHSQTEAHLSEKEAHLSEKETDLQDGNTQVSYGSDDFNSEVPSKPSEVEDKLASVNLSDVSAISEAQSDLSFGGDNIQSISQLESLNEDDPSEKTKSYTNDFSDESV